MPVEVFGILVPGGCDSHVWENSPIVNEPVTMVSAAGESISSRFSKFPRASVAWFEQRLV